MRIALLPLAILALVACSKQQPEPQQGENEVTASAEAGPVKGVDRSHHGKTAPAAVFTATVALFTPVVVPSLRT